MTTLSQYMAGSRRYEVTAAVVVAKSPAAAGGELYVYRGATLPVDTSHAQIELLLERKLIRPIGVQR